MTTPLAPAAKIPGIFPGTVLTSEDVCTPAEMAERVQQTWAVHGETLQQYHEIWYAAKHTWGYASFLGIPLMKAPNDLWAYQELIAQHRPQIIVETGTYSGASALWFAFLLDILAIDGKVLTIDFEDRRQCSHPKITFLGGDSRDPLLAYAIEDELPNGPRLFSLDADHTAEHVYQELCLYAPMARPGDWVVVEDTNVSWPEDAGARGGLIRYLTEHPGEFRQDLLPERFLMTCHPGGWLQRIATAP